MIAAFLPVILFASSTVGFYLAYLYGRHTKTFMWREYFFLISVPVAGSLAMVFFYGIEIIYLFVLSMVVGTLLEYGFGKAYHLTLNRRLWTYGKYSVKGYTSPLVAPMWGVAGIVFWLLAKTIGL